jgi:Flp pilus assembly protein TadG
MPGFLQHFRHDQRGVAAVELAIIGTVLIVGMMSVVDVGRYAYETSEVNAAAQAGAEAALVACDLAHTPATLNCPGLTNAVTTAIQTTSLKSQVTLNGAITEGYYCLDKTGALQQASSASSKPSSCAAVQNAAPGATPTLYLQVPVTIGFQPLFPGLTLAQTFAPSVTRTAWMRTA